LQISLLHGGKHGVRHYFGGFNALWIQFAESAFIGSVRIIRVSTWSHLSHSKLRRSKPFGPGMIRARFMRFVHLGQRGRSIGISDGWVEWE
jgi:hypothetical protein